MSRMLGLQTTSGNIHNYFLIVWIKLASQHGYTNVVAVLKIFDYILHKIVYGKSAVQIDLNDYRIDKYNILCSVLLKSCHTSHRRPFEFQYHWSSKHHSAKEILIVLYL